MNGRATWLVAVLAASVAAIPQEAVSLPASVMTFGGSGLDQGFGITTGPDGSVYIAGRTNSATGYSGAYDSTWNGRTDAAVVKFDAAGNLAWGTYLGGSHNDQAFGVAMDPLGNVYVVGETLSVDFPVLGGLDPTFNDQSADTPAGDAWAAKLSPVGELLWSGFIGGKQADEAKDVAVAADGTVYVTGPTLSSDFPATGPRPGRRDGFVVALSPDGQLLWGFFVGGPENDEPKGVASVDFDALVVGGTDSCRKGPQAFAARVGAGGIVWQSCYGGDRAHSVEVSDSGAVFVGATGKKDDVYIGWLGLDGSLLRTEIVGGSGRDIAYGLAILPDGGLYVTGESTGGFPVTDGGTYGGGSKDALVLRYGSAGDLVEAFYVGGAGEDRAARAVLGQYLYATGHSDSPELGATRGDWDGLVVLVEPPPLPPSDPVQIPAVARGR